MSDNYIIEIRPESSGATVQASVVVRDGRGFRFFAATAVFHALDNQLFKHPRAAEVAALRQFIEARATGAASGSGARSH